MQIILVNQFMVYSHLKPGKSDSLVHAKWSLFWEGNWFMNNDPYSHKALVSPHLF